MPDLVVRGAPERITFETAPGVLQQFARTLGAGGAEIDLSACREFDSSLIGVLLELSRRASATGRKVRYRNPSANLRKLAKLYGVEGLLFDDRD